MHEIGQVKHRIGGLGCPSGGHGFEVARELPHRHLFLDVGRMFGDVGDGVILQKVLLDLMELLG